MDIYVYVCIVLFEGCCAWHGPRVNINFVVMLVFVLSSYVVVLIWLCWRISCTARDCESENGITSFISVR